MVCTPPCHATHTALPCYVHCPTMLRTPPCRASPACEKPACVALPLASPQTGPLTRLSSQLLNLSHFMPPPPQLISAPSSAFPATMVHREIKHKKPPSRHKVYCYCGFLHWTLGCTPSA
eukprot:1552840-Rhodomonas_salina.1